ncbi:MAG: CBS domain-containing protein, partial [Bacteroidetes bacterium]|nr:CBS domain-containing protein [Bacteroidota bacterium]
MKYLILISFIIGATADIIGQPTQKKNDLSNGKLELYIKQQIEIVNNWKLRDPLPDFLANPEIPRHYYKELDKYGGLIQLAIIEQLTNKDILLRIITGCEKKMDISFHQKLPMGEADFANYVFGIYKFLDLRTVAEYRFRKLYSTKQLGHDVAKMKLNLEDCDEFTKLVIESYSALKTTDTKYIKGFIFGALTRTSENQGITFTTVEDSTITQANTPSYILQDMKRMLTRAFESNWNSIKNGSVDPNKILVKDIMTTNVITINPNTSLYDAMLKLNSKKIKHLPVVSDNVVVGIITAMDILRVQPAY